MCLFVKSRRIFLTVCIAITSLLVNGQTSPGAKNLALDLSTNLPIITIDTDSLQEIPNEPKIHALMQVIHNPDQALNHIDDLPNIYSGHIGIEIRGNTSASYPQRPYGIETRDIFGNNRNIPLFHMPRENDWILISNYNDRVLLRNSLSYQLARLMGHYAPRTQHCEVIINGSYEGIYVFTEKLKVDPGRVALGAMQVADTIGDRLTGGYLFKIDYEVEFNEDNSWLSNYSPLALPGRSVHYVFHDPKPGVIAQAQKDYIRSYVDGFEDILYSDEFSDLAAGYSAYIDVASVIDYMLISEISRNPDAYKKSKYFHKARDSEGGKLFSGPIWDFDWGYKNYGESDGSGWAYESYSWMNPTPNGWIERCMQDTLFRQQLGYRYHTIRQSFLSTDSIFAYIDTHHEMLNEAQERHYERWPILGTDEGAFETDDHPDTYQGEVDKFKNWLATRLNWLDANMPAYIDLSDDLNPFIKEPVVDDPGSNTSIAENPVHILRVFPNPAREYAYIESNLPMESIELYTLTGQQILAQQLNGKYSERIDLYTIKTGLYLLRIFGSDGNSMARKIEIQ